jgi:hypothetical protein
MCLAFLALAACSKKSAPAPTATCSDVGEAAVRFWKDKESKATADEGRQTARKMAAFTSVRLTDHCKQDGWSAEAIQCASTGEFSKCQSLLTKEQNDKLLADAPPISPE